jgi:hypothetical protein
MIDRAAWNCERGIFAHDLSAAKAVLIFVLVGRGTYVVASDVRSHEPCTASLPLASSELLG